MARPLHALLALGSLFPLGHGAWASAPAHPLGDPEERALDYARDVRPILSENCFACHGPDEAQRQAGLRLDTPEGARAALRSGGAAVVPPAVESSALVHRISTEDPARLMPPPETGKSLSEDQKDLLRRWIDGGAEWSQHWSFVPPQAPELPEVQQEGWARQPLDFFVLEKLEEAGLEPMPAADRATLARRAALALTGMPLTTVELDAYLADRSENAYEQLVDRLIASPRYGEHMARYWMDAARYADTHGLHLDNLRSMWPWRDQVVNALNAGQPFDQFTTEMLAGDLLPNATPEQIIASGFNRNNPSSAEGGMIAAEYRTIYAKDRTDTTSTIWLGLTVGCAKCHDHKYDPISAKDYYSLYAFFDELGDEASDRNIANPVPFVAAPSQAQVARLAELDAQLTKQRAELDAPMPEVDAAEARWQADLRSQLQHRWNPLIPRSATSRAGTPLVIEQGGSVRAEGEAADRDSYSTELYSGDNRISALRLDALVAEGGRIPGRASNQNFVLSTVRVEAWPVGRPHLARNVPLAAAASTYDQKDYPIEAVLDSNSNTGWAGLGSEGDRSAVLMFAEPVGWDGGTMLRVHLDFDSVHVAHTFTRYRLSASEASSFLPDRISPWSLAGPTQGDDARAAYQNLSPESLPQDLDWEPLPKAIDGQVNRLPSDTGVYWLRRTIHAGAAGLLRLQVGSDDAIRIWANGEEIHANPAARGVALDQDEAQLPLRAGENQILMAVVNYGGATGFAFRLAPRGDSLDAAPGRSGLPHSLALTLDGLGEPSEAALAQLRRRYRSEHAPAWLALSDAVAALQTERDAFEAGFPTTLVSRPAMQATEARLLMRGQYDQPGEVVEADTPAVLPAFPADAPRDRLGLARWLTDPGHPLTARVTVNRHWQRFFGTGLVKTSEDFGSQGEWPSHRRLLDHLATSFVADGWDLKNLHRRIVLSASFRQQSAALAAQLELDPDNRLISRGPRYRLDGEVLRDQALSLAGLMIEELGGAPVKPYQPDGIWFAVGYSRSNTVRFQQDEGAANWRRSLYTFWKRTAPPPNLATFDAPSREACTVRRERTNTPMQALVLMNDRQFVEMARAFASRILREGGNSDAERAAWAFRSATARQPQDAELKDLLGLLAEAREHFATDRDGAEALRSVGDAPVDEELPAVEHAAHTMLANLILNLDETVTLH